MMETGEETGGNGHSAETAEAPDHYVEKIEAAADKFADFKVARTLAGDLRDFVLDLLRTLPRTWAQMSEAEQTARAYGVSNACRKVVRDAVALLETDERTHDRVSISRGRLQGERQDRRKVRHGICRRGYPDCAHQSAR